MLKISTKLTLWYSSATLLIIAAMSFTVYYIYEAERRSSIDSDLQDYAYFLASGLEADTMDLASTFKNLMKVRNDIPLARPRSHKFALADNDSIILDENSIANLDSILYRMPVEEEEADTDTSSFSTINYNGTQYRVFITPLSKSDLDSYDLIVITTLDKLFESLLQLRWLLMMIAPAALALSGIVGYFVARRALQPVSEITGAAAKISVDNLKQRVPVGKSQDELAKLAATFNRMIERLESTFQSQQRFIADASHDIRTPLTVIQTELELLKSSENLQYKTKHSIDVCLCEVNRLTVLTESLLLLARADARQLSLNRSEVRLDELVFECVKQLNNLAKQKGVVFQLDIDSAIELRADDQLLKRVFMNATENAIKYSVNDNRVLIHVTQVNSSAIVEINNQGKPIPVDVLPIVFERFKRGDSSRSTDGFGLGMSIIKTLTELHGGRVTIESDEATGTTLKIDIPIV